MELSEKVVELDAQGWEIFFFVMDTSAVHVINLSGLVTHLPPTSPG